MGRRDKPIPEGDLQDLHLGARMRQARQGKDMSLSELAKRLAYTKGHLSAVENGVGRPSRDLVAGYEHELGLEQGTLTAKGEEEAAVGSPRPHRTPIGGRALADPGPLTKRAPSRPGMRFGGGFRLGRIKTGRSNSKVDTLRSILGEIDEFDRRVKELRQMVVGLIDTEEAES